MTRPRIGPLAALVTLAAALLLAACSTATVARAPQSTQPPTPPPKATNSATQASVAVPEPTATLRPPWRRSKRIGEDGGVVGVATATPNPSSEDGGTATPISPTPTVTAQSTPTLTESSTDAPPEQTPTPSFPRFEFPTPAATTVPPEPTREPTNTPEPTKTPVPPLAPTPGPTPIPAPTETAVPTATGTVIPTTTVTPVATATAVPTATNTSVPTATATSTATPIPTPTPTLYVPLEDDYGDSAMAATLIEVGEIVDGDIEDGDDVDFFLLQPTAKMRYSISVSLDTLFDSQVSLWDAGGKLVVYNDDFGNSFASRIEWTAPDAGSYFISVENADYVSTGSYGLFISELAADEHGDDASSATNVPESGIIEGSIDAPDDIDYVAVDLIAGAEYEINVNLLSLSDSYLTVWDTDGVTLLAENDDISGSLASRLIWVAPSSGTYYIAVEGVEAEGSYQLTIAITGG